MAGPPVRREAQGAAPRREHRLLQLDREPVLGLRDLPLALQRVTGLPQGALAAAQVADVADHRPHRDGAAVRAEHRLAHHVDGAHRAVGPHDAELAVDRPPVDQAAGHHVGEHLLVLGEQPGRQLVQGERAVLRGAAEDAVQLVGPLHTVGEQVPLRAARPAERADGRRVRQPVLGGQVGKGSPRRDVQVDSLAQLAQVRAQVVELVDGEVAQRPLPAKLRVLGGHGARPRAPCRPGCGAGGPARSARPRHRGPVAALRDDPRAWGTA